MPLNNVLSGSSPMITKKDYEEEFEKYNMASYGESEEFGFVFIQPDNTLWAISKRTENIPVKIAKDVVSVKADFSMFESIVILKKNGDVLICTENIVKTITDYNYKKLFRNTIMIDMNSSAIYALKTDNCLWAYTHFNNTNIGGYKSFKNIPIKIMNDVIFFKTNEDVLYAEYCIIIKNDGSLWIINMNDSSKSNKIINNNIVACDIDADKLLAVDANGNLYLYYYLKEPLDNNLIKISSNIKYAEFKNGNIYALKSDNTLYRYSIDSLQHLKENKVSDNIYSLIGDMMNFAIDNNNTLLKINNNSYYEILDYNIIKPIYINK